MNPCFSWFLERFRRYPVGTENLDKNPNEIKGLLVDVSSQAGLLHFFGMACIRH